MLKVSITGGQIGGGTPTKARVSRFGEIALRESLILGLDQSIFIAMYVCMYFQRLVQNRDYTQNSESR